MKQTKLGRKIAELRNAKGLTQEELVEKCKISIRTLQRIESGHVLPRYYTLREISKALDCELFETLKEREKGKKFFLECFLELIYKHGIDLFNLKTHKMQKLSILTGTTLAFVFGLAMVFSDCHAQKLSVNKYFSDQSPNGILFYFPKIKGDSFISNIKDTTVYQIGKYLVQENNGNIFLDKKLMGYADRGDTVVLKKESILKKAHIIVRKARYSNLPSTNDKKIVYIFPESSLDDYIHGTKYGIEETFEIDGFKIKELNNKIFFNKEYVGDAFENDTVILRMNQLSILKFYAKSN